MEAIEEMIEARELDVRCWQCDWHEGRSLKWLSAQRHMNCPHCESVIVLDTSEVRREIARQRRQLTALHEQMGKLLEGASKTAQRTSRPSRMSSLAPPLDLALAKKHPDTLIPSMRPAAGTRRFSN